MDDFNLAEVFSTFLKEPAELFDDSSLDLSEMLDQVTDRMATSYETVAEEQVRNALMCLLYHYADLDSRVKERLQDLIMSGFMATGKEVQSALGTNDAQYMTGLRGVVERYMLLVHWLLVDIDQGLNKAQNVVTTTGGRTRTKVPDSVASAAGVIASILDNIEATLISVCSLFVTPTEMDLFSSLYLRPAFLFMENEALMKNSAVKLRLFKIVGLSIKMYQQQASVQTSVSQLLTYYEHMGEPLAELLSLLREQYDHTKLTEETLQDIGNKKFDGNVDAKGPKLVSVFLIKLSILEPLLVLKQMAVVVNLLESDAFTLRCAIIEVLGNIIVGLSRLEDNVQQNKTKIEGLVDVIEERALDVNPYCRSRALQMLATVCGLQEKFTKRRPQFTELALQALSDKSSTVRRNSLKLLSVLISTHPFGLLHGSQLSLTVWNRRLSGVTREIETTIQEVTSNAAAEQTRREISEDHDDNTDNDGKALNDERATQLPDNLPPSINISPEATEKINKLQLTRQYYIEAIDFIAKIHEALFQVENLLFSKNKSEVLDSMNLFVLVDAYGVDIARVGIRKMLHLIWAKANNDDGQAIQKHLIECYEQLFFDTPPDMNEKDASTLVAKNLITLTNGATVSELTSLERLIVMAMEKREGLISPGVIRTLWKVYGHTRGAISNIQRQGAIIILGMVAKADKNIVLHGIDTLLKIGLGDEGLQDFSLARYTCIALQQCVPEEDWKKASAHSLGPARLPVTHEVVERLGTILITPCDNMEWFGLAEQAVKTINNLCESPEEVFTEIIKHKSKEVFQGDSANISKDASLSQLLFICGEIALKTMVHLERCETMFKRTKIEIEKAKALEESSGKKSKKAEPEDDLEEAAGGTTEDDFTDAIARVRENELLFGPSSILATFGDMVSAICNQMLTQRIYKPLAISAMLCLAKFMCVSATYCESNLEILIALMDKSDSSTIRSNCVIALGDIAVCFNYILDRAGNTDALYQRLHDEFPVVQRTCLMTLTFLILAGQVKVKGQLGEMAKCIEDSDKRISDLARMFFSELSTKEGAIYNGFIDMFSMLSADAGLSDDSLHRILKFLIGFIDKDKQVKQLSDKLFGRLSKCESKKQWDDLAFVLSILPHKNETITQAIQEGYSHVVTVE